METIGSTSRLCLVDRCPDFSVSFTCVSVPFSVLKVGLDTVGKVWFGVRERCCPQSLREPGKVLGPTFL